MTTIELDTASAWVVFIIGVAAVLAQVVIAVTSLVMVPRNRRPQTALAWLLLIYILPIVGFLLFLLLGSRRLPKRRREKQTEINEYILNTTEGMDRVRKDPPWPPWLEPIVELNRTLGAMPLVGGNTAELYTDYAESIAAMTAAVREAERIVHVEFYILSLDEATADFFDALEDAVRRGLTVRVLYDHVASVRVPGYRVTKRRLIAMGVEFRAMLPVRPWRGQWQRPDLRNHRKFLILDGTTAFTGSQNMVDRGYHRKPLRSGDRLAWKELVVRFDGPIAAGIEALFATDWYAETDELLLRESVVAPEVDPEVGLDAQVVPSGPAFEGENNLRLFNSLLYAAQEQIQICSPYFVPDESMLYAITTAAQSGLDVQLFVSEIGDQTLVFHAQRSYYEELLRAGVRIWLYRSPTVLHAKHFTIDDQVAVIGSSNMDMRSFSLNLEVSVMVRGASIIKRLREVEQSYRDNSTELTLEQWMNRPAHMRAFDDLARVTATVQ
ncbi:cardiolipin synthase [Yonghaparkia sp. Root332]|uniref:cardiolipin synthase n=1 Tax=Yonghaparkia sp. Root332 TaxID=1736516 RepID=UPI0006FB660D|nr:cardiolipin synthase [Yonghaparkia sp. Root332]KQV25705.1 cardiolipin synthase [Yonghaparkia sp. Root332]